MGLFGKAKAKIQSFDPANSPMTVSKSVKLVKEAADEWKSWMDAATAAGVLTA